MLPSHWVDKHTFAARKKMNLFTTSMQHWRRCDPTNLYFKVLKLLIAFGIGLVSLLSKA